MTKRSLVIDAESPEDAAKTLGRTGAATPRSSRMILLSVICILIMELCERLTYYSITANLVLFATSNLKFDKVTAAYIVQIFTGTCYLVPIIGGYISDAIAGKYNTIYGSGLIYLVGAFLLPAAAVDYKKWFGKNSDGLWYDLDVASRRGYFLCGLFFVAMGTGGIKANVAPFGAQQIQKLGPAMVQRFFNWFYWFINVGALIAYSGVAYVQQEVSFEIGYAIPFITMVMAMIILCLGRNIYEHQDPVGSVVAQSLKTLKEGIKRRKHMRAQQLTTGKEYHYLDGAKKEYGGSFDSEFVDGVLSSFKVVPIFTTIIFYWAIYSQMSTTFYLQGTVMDIKVNGAPIPVAALNSFNVIIILLIIPVLDVVYTMLQKVNKCPTPLQRIGFGLLLAAQSVLVAGILEIYRMKELSSSGGVIQVLADDTYNASHISIFAQIPEFALVGTSEVFTSITGLEFAYSQAPDAMKGLVMGFFLLTTGLGNYVASAIIAIVNVATVDDPWFNSKDINKGKLYNLFFLLSGLMVLAFFFFLLLTKVLKFENKNKVNKVVNDMELTADDDATAKL